MNNFVLVCPHCAFIWFTKKLPEKFYYCFDCGKLIDLYRSIAKYVGVAK